LSARYDRDSAEFGRVLAFSDGLFAIAMTLLVVSVTVPSISDTDSISDLADGLNDRVPDLTSFFISFAVIGRYWLAHHRFISLLSGIDQGLIGLNLIYLAFIAFLPFPTALLGEYFENPLSIVIYAVSVGVISGWEVVLLRHAYEKELFARPLTPAVYRFAVLASLTPVFFFALSIPIAFASTTVAAVSWFLTIPAGTMLERRAPEGAEELFG
jgi:uncharacterized membrane protein